jgi:hypothetical protein
LPAFVQLPLDSTGLHALQHMADPHLPGPLSFVIWKRGNFTRSFRKNGLQQGHERRRMKKKAKPQLHCNFIRMGFPLFCVLDRFRYREGISGRNTAYGHANW